MTILTTFHLFIDPTRVPHFSYTFLFFSILVQDHNGATQETDEHDHHWQQCVLKSSLHAIMNVVTCFSTFEFGATDPRSNANLHRPDSLTTIADLHVQLSRI